jgi:type I restriction enzyme S subunit
MNRIADIIDFQQASSRDPMTPTLENPGLPSRPLPPGWRWVRLGEVIAEALPGFACGARDPKGVVQLRMNNVGIRGNLVWDEFIRVPADSLTVQKCRLLAGDVVFNNTNSTELVGKSALFSGYGEPVVYSNHFTRLRAKPERLDPSYLASWLVDQWESRVFENLCNRWIGQSAVKNDKLLGLEIPLPPVSEQRRIAGILKEQMAAVERARAAAQAQLEAAKALPAAYLRSVFNSPQAQKWPKKRLGEVCTITARIVDPKLPEYGALPHVNGENIESGLCRLKYLNSASDEGMTSVKYLFDPGDVLYSKLRPYLRKALVSHFRGVCSADMYPIKFRRNVLIPSFAAWLLITDEFTSYADEESRRARMPKLNRQQLFAWSAPVPPLTEQRRIAAQLSEQMAAVERARKALEEQLDAIHKLPAALLRRAFRGEL